MDTKIDRLFKSEFLNSFIIAKNLLPFTDKEIIIFDKDLSNFEQIILNPDIQKSLITKNELLASFAISKAENSNLTFSEAVELNELIENNKTIEKKKRLTQKDHDKLEFFNILRTFKKLNKDNFELKDLTKEFILNLHLRLTKGMDIYKKYIPDITLYKSGRWRDNNLIRVGSYVPPNFKLIEASVKELIIWIKDNPSPTNIAIFHTALYALHPFNNGNKRVCRILEHLMLREIGLNNKNLYNTSYYYHKEKERYYKYLLFSLERKNLNHFVGFVQESIILSIISVVKTSLESKRLEFINRNELERQTKTIIKPLIKRREIQFKNLYKIVKRKFARQTFVNYLEKAIKSGTVVKKSSGRATYYSLNVKNIEDEQLQKWISFASSKLSYISDELKLA